MRKLYKIMACFLAVALTLAPAFTVIPPFVASTDSAVITSPSMASMATEEGIPAPILYMNGERRVLRTSLYQLKNGDRYSVKVRLIPYFAIANRGATDMIVWTMVK